MNPTPPANAEATEAVAKPKYYIASKTKHASFWRANRRGDNNVTSTWIDEAGEGETADYSELASRCLSEIEAADFLILYCEKGEVLKGALIEAGMALALGKPVRCVGDCESISRVFKEHPLWSSHPSILDAVAQQIRTAQPTPSGPTAGDSMDVHYAELEAERDRLLLELAVCRVALGIQPDEKIPEQAPQHGSILVDRAGSRRRISPATENEEKLAHELQAAETKAGAMEEQVKNQVVIFQSIGRLVGVPENNDSCTVLFNTVKAALARVETAEKTIQLFGSWLDHWSIREQKPSDVYAAWDKARKESKQATRPAGIGWAA